MFKCSLNSYVWYVVTSSMILPKCNLSSNTLCFKELSSSVKNRRRSNWKERRFCCAQLESMKKQEVSGILTGSKEHPLGDYCYNKSFHVNFSRVVSASRCFPAGTLCLWTETSVRLQRASRSFWKPELQLFWYEELKVLWLTELLQQHLDTVTSPLMSPIIHIHSVPFAWLWD